MIHYWVHFLLHWRPLSFPLTIWQAVIRAVWRDARCVDKHPPVISKHRGSIVSMRTTNVVSFLSYCNLLQLTLMADNWWRVWLGTVLIKLFSHHAPDQTTPHAHKLFVEFVYYFSSDMLPHILCTHTYNSCATTTYHPTMLQRHLPECQTLLYMIVFKRSYVISCLHHHQLCYVPSVVIYFVHYMLWHSLHFLLRMTDDKSFPSRI